MGLDQNSDEIQKKGNENERPYGCPCGKKYLSYPALFTHVKQKHDGKAPGPLIKPKTEKTRGRPRINSANNESEGEDSIFYVQEQVRRAIQDVRVGKQFEFGRTDGKRSCNDMMSQFLSSYDPIEVQTNTLTGFACYIKFFIQEKLGKEYWFQHSPSQIIDTANQMVKQLENYKEEFPLQKKLLTDLTFILFKWMYRNKWTDHKLIRRSSDSMTSAD